MSASRWLSALAAMLLAASVGAAGPRAEASRRDAPSWPTLSRFSSEAEFLSYLDAVNAAQHEASRRSGAKQNMTPPPPCNPQIEECPDEEADEAVAVTPGRAVNRAPASPAPTASGATITNVQTAGVDEGDIVKMIGRFLIVLQDGRLFTIDTGAASADLALVDRANVYRSANASAWYDEILAQDNRIIVTGYNYGEAATEYSVFSLSENGRLTREAVYFISSNDYYDVENYATRLVNGNLVIYTPLNVANLTSRNAPQWPLVRRWLREGDARPTTSAGRRLFDARDIYRPIQSTLMPLIHTISVCPLGSPRAGDELECRSTAIAGTNARQFYVSNDHVYLWLSTGYDYYGLARRQADCAARTPGSFAYAGESALFQISLADGQPRAMFVRGVPYDQLGMEATANAFHALAVWRDGACNDYQEDLPLRYFSTPLSAFSTTPPPAREGDFTPLPNAGGAALENRFTDNYLVYGGRRDWSSYAPQGAAALSGRVVAVPSNNPRAAAVIDTPHNVIRVESLGRKAVVTGYRNEGALSISIVDLRRRPRLASTTLLEGRYESEGRSHAFNASVDADGAGLMGLPTVEVQRRSGRWWWNSQSSDVSFLSLNREGAVTSLGALTASAKSADPSYHCEVSCIDWYGNSRPIFVNGRVFALSGTELIEGAVSGGHIVESGRVNLTAPPRGERIAGQ